MTDIITNEKELHSSGYTFYLKETIDPEDNTIELTFLSKTKRHQLFPCVKIELDTDRSCKDAYLQSVQYNASCSINSKPLEKHSGTIVMIQVALLYTCDTYPYIERVHLQDETFIDIPGKPLITPRRLLNGKLGWYEEYLGAIPRDRPLKKKIEFLRKSDTMSLVQSLLPPEANDPKWWGADATESIATKVKPGLFPYLIGSAWVIPKATLKAYNVSYTETLVPKQHGGAYRRRLCTMIATRQRNYINPHHYTVNKISVMR